MFIACRRHAVVKAESKFTVEHFEIGQKQEKNFFGCCPSGALTIHLQIIIKILFLCGLPAVTSARINTYCKDDILKIFHYYIQFIPTTKQLVMTTVSL